MFNLPGQAIFYDDFRSVFNSFLTLLIKQSTSAHIFHVCSQFPMFHFQKESTPEPPWLVLRMALVLWSVANTPAERSGHCDGCEGGPQSNQITSRTRRKWRITIKNQSMSLFSDASFVEISNYQVVQDDGVYECSAVGSCLASAFECLCFQPGMSASYRLKGEKQQVLPPGLRFCYGEEMASCKHADNCYVDISTKHFSCEWVTLLGLKTSCRFDFWLQTCLAHFQNHNFSYFSCENGWTGASCDMISDPVSPHHVLTPQVCAYCMSS